MQLIVKFRLSPEQEPRSKANERGVRVPEDVSVVSFDRNEASTLSVASL